MPKHRYKIIISYDGTPYSGWQVQKTGIAIQPFIQKALATILRVPTDLTGSGRTDSGVHALGQVAHFDTEAPIEDSRKFLVSLNALLPIDIQVQELHSVDPEFHARYKATGKIYHYHIHLDPIINPFTRLYRMHLFGSFCINRLKEAISHLLGTHDFTAFTHKAHKGSASHDPVRTIQRIDVVPEEGGIRLEFEADGFLYKMVRNIVGTLIDIAQGRRNPDAIASILASKDRKKGGSCAPAHGLFLIEVKYK
jgi:tRNA pseudouridine38-40 synthase